MCAICASESVSAEAAAVPERDNNQQRESLSDSESASGEDLIQSDELKRKGREAKEALLIKVISQLK